jgi:hypothetical protein
LWSDYRRQRIAMLPSSSSSAAATLAHDLGLSAKNETGFGRTALNMPDY